MFVNGFLAGRYVARALHGAEPPPKLTLVARGPDGELLTVPLIPADSETPGVKTGIESVAQFEARGHDAASGVLVDGGRVLVFMPPSIGSVVLACRFDDTATLTELQVGQQGEPRNVDELTEGFREGLHAGAEEASNARAHELGQNVYSFGNMVGLALAEALVAMVHGQRPFTQSYGTPIIRKRGATEFTVPTLPDDRTETLARWISSVKPEQFALVQMPRPGLLSIKVKPHDFVCALKFAIVDGAPRTSPPGLQHGPAYDGMADLFLDGVNAGIAHHRAAALLEPGYGTLPVDAA